MATFYFNDPDPSRFSRSRGSAGGDALADQGGVVIPALAMAFH
jgi:hypothetical protein